MSFSAEFLGQHAASDFAPGWAIVDHARMQIEFIGQPFSSENRLGRILADALGDANSLLVMTAWGQTSGMSHIADGIRDLRERGGSASAILGLDGGIATRESLELAVELFDPALVFHDPGSRLFHPKVYCVEKPDQITIAVGSSNLTGGGFFRNYEANIVLRLSPADPEDQRVYEAVQAYHDALTEDSMPCKPLTLELIARLAEEETLVTTRKKREETERTAKAKAESLAKQIFGSPVSGLPSVPQASRRQAGPTRKQDESPQVRPSDAPPVLRWWKQLTASDVLRKPESSHQRNYVALSKADHPIDFKSWFRYELFGPAAWSEETMRSGNVKEVALVPFDVGVEDESIGRYELRVDHAEARIANQNNSPTYLNWSTMVDLIRDSDFRGWWLELSRLADETYRLRLLRDEPKPD